MRFLGYPRESGLAGVRNHMVIIPSTFCANGVVKKIAGQLPAAVPLLHDAGCGQIGSKHEMSLKLLRKMGEHPNVGAVLVVGLGCERIDPYGLAQAIAMTGKPVETVVIQKTGGSVRAIAEGVKAGAKLALILSKQHQEMIDITQLRIALKCGGSDATSGLAANPVVGIMCEELVHKGGSALLGEITELIGAEYALAKMAKNPQIGQQILDLIGEWESRMKKAASDAGSDYCYVAPGNLAGGITTVEEKALGNMRKAGRSVITKVLDYGESTFEAGVGLMDCPSHDAQSVTAMLAGGAQVCVFTTGRGTPAGFPIAPVIKITANPHCPMPDNIDYNASAVLKGESSVQKAGRELFDRLLAIASGEPTVSEILNHDELFTLSTW